MSDSDETITGTDAGALTLPAPTEPRAPDGRFLPGKSGNPSGRPPSQAQQISTLTRTLETYVRTHVKAERVVKILDKVCDKAEKGDLKAAKLIFEYTLSKPATNAEEDGDKSKGGIVIRIENATFKAQQSDSKQPLEGEYSES